MGSKMHCCLPAPALAASQSGATAVSPSATGFKLLLQHSCCETEVCNGNLASPNSVYVAYGLNSARESRKYSTWIPVDAYNLRFHHVRW